MQLPSENPGNYSNGHRTTSLLIYAEVSKIIVTGDAQVRSSNIVFMRGKNSSFGCVLIGQLKHSVIFDRYLGTVMHYTNIFSLTAS